MRIEMVLVGAAVLVFGVGCGGPAKSYREQQVITPGGTYSVKIGEGEEERRDSAGNVLPPRQYRRVEKEIITPGGKQTVHYLEEIPAPVTPFVPEEPVEEPAATAPK